MSKETQTRPSDVYREAAAEYLTAANRGLPGFRCMREMAALNCTVAGVAERHGVLPDEADTYAATLDQSLQSEGGA